MSDIMNLSNPVLTDCPIEKEEQNFMRQSDKITALYCRLTVMMNYRVTATVL